MEETIIGDKLKSYPKPNHVAVQDARKKFEEDIVYYTCMASVLMADIEEDVGDCQKQSGNEDASEKNGGDSTNLNIIAEWTKHAKQYKQAVNGDSKICPVVALRTDPDTTIQTMYKGRTACFFLSSSTNEEGKNLLTMRNPRFTNKHKQELKDDLMLCVNNGCQLIDVTRNVFWKFIENI